MDIEYVWRQYDRFERREALFPGFRRYELPNLVHLVHEVSRRGFVSWSRLSMETADAAIDGELDFFAKLDMPFEWKHYGQDKPDDLKKRLESHGFAIGEDESIMALDLGDMPPSLRLESKLDIRRIADRDRLADVAAVHAAVWQENPKHLLDELAHDLSECPECIAMYAAYEEDKPVSSAWIRFPSNSPFASLWGGSTLKEFRGRGIYSAMLALRAREARRRGYAWLTIDAGPMSRPIVEKQGFHLLATSNPCTIGEEAD